MIRKIAFTVFFLALILGLSQKAAAQRGSRYDNGAGLFVDFGNGGTYVGPHLKHYFDANNAGQAMIIFGSGNTIVGVEYSYNKTIPNANGLKWNLGFGPQIGFGHGTSDFYIRPIAGLEYKIPQVPIAFGLDWRPAWTVTHGSSFEAARFGFAFKFTF